MFSSLTCQAVLIALVTLLNCHSAVTNAAAQSETSVQRASKLSSSQDTAEAQSLSQEVQKLIDQGKYEEAMPKAVLALEIRERVFGNEHPDVASSLGDVAYLLYKKSDYTKARELYDRALTILEKLRVENQDAVRILNNVGLLYYALGDRTNAETFFGRALTMEEKIPRGIENPKAANIMFNLALILLDKGDSEGAEQLYRRALKLKEKQLDLPEPKLVLMLNNLGLAHYQIGQFVEAVRLFKLALAIIKKEFGDDPPAALPVTANLLMVYLQDGNYGEAEILVQRELVLLKRNPGNNSYYIAMAYNSIGQFYKVKGDYKKAEEFFQAAGESVKHFSALEQPYAAEILTNLGLLYLERDQYAKAEDPLQRAMTIRRYALGLTDPNYATSAANLGELYRRKGNYIKATSLYEEALTIYRNSIGEQHSYSASVINNLGLLHYSRGDWKTAEDQLQKALKIREQVLRPEHPDIVASLINLATCYRSDGRLDQAGSALQRALGILEQSPGQNDLVVAQALNNLGLVHYDKGELKEAEPLFRRALAISEKIFGLEDFRLISTVNNLGLVYQARGDLNRAGQFYERALAIVEKSKTAPHPMVATLLRNLSSLNNVKGDINRAVNFAQRAGEIEEQDLDLTMAKGSEDQNHTYWLTFRNTTAADISLHVQDAPNNRSAARLALTTVLRRKGRVLDAMANNVRTLRARSSPVDKDLVDKLSEVQTQLASMISESPDKTDAGYYPDFVAKFESYQKLQARLTARSAELRKPSQPVTIESIQKLIPERSALVEFVCYNPTNIKNPKRGEWTPRHYVAYILRHSGDVEWADLGESQPIDYNVWNLRIALRNPKSTPDEKNVDAFARELYEQVMRPIASKLRSDTQQLLISPDSMLQFVPFEALMDGDSHYLIERFAVTYLSSARDVLGLQSTGRSRRPPLIVVNPDFNSRTLQPKSLGQNPVAPSPLPVSSGPIYESLSGTIEEAEQIARLFHNARILKGSKASEAALKQIHGPSILHIATHGFFPGTQPVGLKDPDSTKIDGVEVFKPAIALLKLEANPTRSGAEYISSLSQSGIALAGANNHDRAGENDGILTALEMSGLDLRATKLVVLSACETAMGDVESGNGVDGLRRSLLLAGAESQVMSLWKVNDEITRETMIKFYTRLRAGAGRADALRQAKLDLLRSKNYRHPYFWASFVQSGDWRSIYAKSNRVRPHSGSTRMGSVN